MKKLAVSLVFISSVVFGDNFACNISGYKAIETVDNFGNKNTKYISKLKATILEWIRKKDYENLEKFFAENIYLNIDGYHGFNSLLNDSIERATFFNGTVRGILSGAISSGQLPSSIEINTLNIATVKNRVKINTNIYNVVGAFTNYFFSSKSINTMRDRLLLMISFLLQKNSILIPFECKNNIYSDFSENLLADYMATGFIKLLQKKDKDGLYLAFLLLKHKYSEVDKFLLNIKKVKNLFLLGRKHYLEFAETHKSCNLNDEFDFKVGYICFKNKEQAMKTFNTINSNSKHYINKINSIKVLYSGSSNWGYIMKNYCNLKRNEILPKIFKSDDKYCIFEYKGISK